MAFEKTSKKKNATNLQKKKKIKKLKINYLKTLRGAGRLVKVRSTAAQTRARVGGGFRGHGAHSARLRRAVVNLLLGVAAGRR
jgi:hypothetical protein